MTLDQDFQLISTLQNGKLAVIPTDTIYGLVGRADNQLTVEQIYEVKDRTPTKPSIILIAKLDQLKLFGIDLDQATEKLLNQVWPGEVSVILPCPHTHLTYLHRDTNTLAFRLPASQDLQQLIAQVGPLIAPSANPEGQPPAETIDQAKNYFGDRVDYYFPTDKVLVGAPSTLVAIEGGQFMIKRQGRVIISNVERAK